MAPRITRPKKMPRPNLQSLKKSNVLREKFELLDLEGKLGLFGQKYDLQTSNNGDIQDSFRDVSPDPSVPSIKNQGPPTYRKGTRKIIDLSESEDDDKEEDPNQQYSGQSSSSSMLEKFRYTPATDSRFFTSNHQNAIMKYPAISTKSVMRSQARQKTAESEAKIDLNDPFFEFEDDGGDFHTPGPLCNSQSSKARTAQSSKYIIARSSRGRFDSTYDYHSTRKEDSWIDDHDISSSESEVSSNSDDSSDSDASMDSDDRGITDDEFDLDIDMEF